MVKNKFVKPIHNYQRWLMPGALLLGFLIDLVTFRWVSFTTALWGMAVYLIGAGISIIFIQKWRQGYWRLIFLYIFQYSLGSLLSAFIIFYSASGSIFASWPFLAVLVFLFIANEVFKQYINRADIQVVVYFFAAFAFFNIALPYLLREIGTAVFILGGVLSLLFIWAFGKALIWLMPEFKKVKKVVAGGVIAVFAVINVFYFTHLIPPIPLVLRDIGIYQKVERTSAGEYLLVKKRQPFWEKLLPGERFHLNGNREMYAFTAVFAPMKMVAPIVHEWQYYDPLTGKWITKNTVSFNIKGGRKEGFRGFSKTAQTQPGWWRVNVKTANGQIIGRKTFKVLP